MPSRLVLPCATFAQDGMNKAKTAEGGEDEQKRLHDEVQKLTDDYVKKVDEALSAKEEEIMQV